MQKFLITRALGDSRPAVLETTMLEATSFGTAFNRAYRLAKKKFRHGHEEVSITIRRIKAPRAKTPKGGDAT